MPLDNLYKVNQSLIDLQKCMEKHNESLVKELKDLNSNVRELVKVLGKKKVEK